MKGDQMACAMMVEIYDNSRIEVFPVNASGEQVGSALVFRSLLKAAAYVEKFNQYLSGPIPGGRIS